MSLSCIVQTLVGSVYKCTIEATVPLFEIKMDAN